eukprot:TRINITY_DN88340_c0_g1_i1.p1 TRINITY_DN88340_c0_g1~~TRINITY_DN88340_c0_g1_i1.p1  ORF type:complete len:309 (-),score=62.69 TRINITY_DN88340_c0_g1_i1:668-1594(-)
MAMPGSGAGEPVPAAALIPRGRPASLAAEPLNPSPPWCAWGRKPAQKTQKFNCFSGLIISYTSITSTNINFFQLTAEYGRKCRINRAAQLRPKAIIREKPMPRSAQAMNAQEAADYLGAHVETVRRLARRGDIPAFKVGKDWRFRREALEQWIETHHQRHARSTVLVVDDEAAIRQAIEHHLTKEGYGVLHASDGLKGLEALQNNSIDLILLDLKMPAMSGPEFLRQMHDQELEVPVIIITGYPDSDMVMKAMTYGPVTLLAKPIPKDMLLRAVRTELGGANLSQARLQGPGQKGALTSNQDRFCPMT